MSTRVGREQVEDEKIIFDDVARKKVKWKEKKKVASKAECQAICLHFYSIIRLFSGHSILINISNISSSTLEAFRRISERDFLLVA